MVEKFTASMKPADSIMPSLISPHECPKHGPTSESEELASRDTPP
jgi:hypothetical protein